MTITLLKSKLQKPKVTEADLNYVGSLTLDLDMMDAADMVPFERVQVVNLNNGSRLETYLIEGERGSGIVCLNGPAARKGLVGDNIIVLSYAQMSPDEAKGFMPRIAYVDENNKVTKTEG